MAASSSRCSQCAGPMTEQDFISNFEIHAKHGLKHKKCPSNIQTGFPEFWSKKYVSNESQYSHQSSGSCTINALETAIRLQSGEKPSKLLINEVLRLASLYTSSMHTGVGDVLPHVTRYKSILKSIDWMQCNVQNMKQVIEKLDKNVCNSKYDVSCVITKPPESIFLHKTYSNNNYILYDSHPRREKGLNGSHILIFTDKTLLNDYLLILFPFVNLGGGYGLYGDMMNQCEATYLQINYNKLKNFNVKNINYQLMSKDLSVIGFKLQKQYENVKNDSSSNLMDKIKTKIKKIKNSNSKKKDNSKYKAKNNNKKVVKDNNEYKGKNNDINMENNNEMNIENKEQKNDGNDIENKENIDFENDNVNDKDKVMKEDKNNIHNIESISDDGVIVNKPKEVLDVNNNNNEIDTPSNKSEDIIIVHKPDESNPNLHNTDNNALK